MLLFSSNILVKKNTIKYLLEKDQKSPQSFVINNGCEILFNMHFLYICHKYSIINSNIINNDNIYLLFTFNEIKKYTPIK